ncbi:hypothetical protein Tco_1503229 [Tanacetum coccineum]
MDDPNITMEEYIRLEGTNKLRWRVFNDTLTSEATLSCEPTVSSLNNDEIDFRISFDEFDDEDSTCMRTRNSNFLNNSNVTIPRRRNKGHAPNIVKPELRTIVAPMAERTIEELLRVPTKGYGEAIVLPEINADHFEIKTNLLQLVQASPFHGLENENPYSHINSFKRITSTLRFRNVSNDVIKLMMFPYSLEGAAKTWGVLDCVLLHRCDLPKDFLRFVSKKSLRFALAFFNTSSTDSQMHNNIMAAGSKDRPPMLGPGRYLQMRSRFLWYIDTKPNGEGLKKSKLSGPYVPSTVLVQAVAATEDVKDQSVMEFGSLLLEMEKSLGRITHDKAKRSPNLVTPQSESVSEEDSDPEQAQRDKDMQKNLALLANQGSLGSKDNEVDGLGTVGSQEKMMMCKQAKHGVPLQAEQADWLADTDEEIDEQELEAYYSFMAKIQEIVLNERGCAANLICKTNSDYEGKQNDF